MRGRFLLIALVLLVATACGGRDRQGAVGGAPLLTTAETADRNGLVAVQGFFWARPGDGVFRLCEASLESFPPQCGEPMVDLTGIDVTRIAGISFSQNVFWAEQLRVRGELSDGTLAAEEIELNATDTTTGLTFRLLIPVELSAGSVDYVALVTNSSNTPIDLKFNTGQSAEVTLTDLETGAVVYRWGESRGFDQAVRELTLEPGETLRYPLAELEFDLKPGVYILNSVLTASPAPGPAIGRAVVR